MTFCFWKISFVHSRSETYHALVLRCFCLKFLPDVHHCVYWVLGEIWAPDSTHKTGNKLLIDNCQGLMKSPFVCEIVWFFSWVNTHPFSLKFVTFCLEFSGDSDVKFQEKNIFGEFIKNLCANQGYPYQNLWIFALLYAKKFLRPYWAEKFHTSTFIGFLHPHKEARP